jgi:DNA-binding response OmpR family regulator
VSSQDTKLLVIDDSELIRTAVSMVLDGNGFEVRCAGNLQEFDELLAAWWPDLILTDVQMPDVTGDELCRTLKSRILVQVVLFSNLPAETLAELAESSGADAYISKLEGFDGLADRLHELVASGEKQDASDGERHIALLDESALSREVAGTVLDREGFDVRTAANLAELSSVLEAWPVDVVLTAFPGDDARARQLCNQIKAKLPSPAPVVFFGDAPGDEAATLAHSFGADDYVSKLDGFQDLIHKLQKLCDAS